MGNKQTVYIVGEVDFKPIKLGGQLIHNGNICVRNPQLKTKKPNRLLIDKNTPLSIAYFYVPNKDAIINRRHGPWLKKNKQARLVLLKGSYDCLCGLTDMKVIDSAIVPMVNV